MRIPRRIVVPTDLSEFSLEALRYAEEVARLFNGEILVLHVIDPRVKTGAKADDAEFEARKAVVHLLMEHAIVPQSLRLEISRGSAVEEILKTVTQFQADLVIMSTHGRSGLRNVLMGSIAEHVVRLSPVPVLTVKPEGPDEIVELRKEDIKLNLHLN
ncbi:MAG TPA: universal stress protein [Bacteroidota bacterium]|nr:universal stress protein [Bacteroidota bacterium]